VSHHPRCVHARNTELARRVALRVDPPLILRDDGMDVAVMTDRLVTMIDLCCPLECLNGRCAHEPKREGPVSVDG
jgi:hypothetical protein